MWPGRACSTVTHTTQHAMTLLKNKQHSLRIDEPNPDHHLYRSNRTPAKGYHFVLFIGAPPGSGKLRITDRFAVCQRLVTRFSGFSVQETQGFFEGTQEDGLKIDVATTEPIAVLEVAEEIREALHLEAVGVSWAGIYQRVLDEVDTDGILRNWGLPIPKESDA